jgi:hypothetical protein
MIDKYGTDWTKPNEAKIQECIHGILLSTGRSEFFYQMLTLDLMSNQVPVCDSASIRELAEKLDENRRAKTILYFKGYGEQGLTLIERTLLVPHRNIGIVPGCKADSDV